MAGKEIRASTVRLTSVSVHPPMMAAKKPKADPMRNAITEMDRATDKVVRMPNPRREAMSRPR